MSDDLPVVRISDQERDRAVAFLRHHCGAGRLTLDEFSDRVALVFDATTDADIVAVTKDLPAMPVTPPSTAVATVGRGRRAVRWTVSIFGANPQKGRWRLDGATNAASFMGHTMLDLREAEVVGETATIRAFAFMGGVDVVVPEGIQVVLTGLAIMGSKHARVRRVPVIGGSPTIYVKAFAFMGGVTVRSKGASDGKRRRKTSGHDRRNERHRQRDEIRSAVAEAIRSGMQPPSLPGAPAPPAHPTILRGIDAVAGAVKAEWPAMRARVAPEGTVTIMFSDIEGFTPMTERLGDHQANRLLQEHYRLVRAQLVDHDGFEVKVHGDGFMVAFSSASRALRCAKAIQAAQRQWNGANPAEPMRVRMGLHTGEAIRDADDFLGTTVNLANRIASAARGEEILVSALLRELCASTGEFAFDDGNIMELKGLSQPHKVYAVRW